LAKATSASALLHRNCPRTGSTDSHFIAFSGVTLVSWDAARLRYGFSSRASGSSAAPK
jgi:hypothetical protein